MAYLREALYIPESLKINDISFGYDKYGDYYSVIDFEAIPYMARRLELT